MRKFIKTFYLWLGLFTFCNVASLVAVTIRQGRPEGGAVLYPLAWVLQLPLVVLLSGVHHGINRLFSLLPLQWKKRARFLLCALFAFVFMGMYAASQMMFLQIESFISWDAFQVAWSNAAQLFPDIAGEMGGELLLIGTLSVLTAWFYTHRYHKHSVGRSPLIPALLGAFCIASGAGGFVAVYRMDEQQAAQVRRRLLPTTYLTFSIIDRLLPSVAPSADFLDGLVFGERVGMEEYFQTMGHPPEEKPDVFFIMLESVSWDHFGFTGYHRKGITPNLDRLAKDSLVFNRAYAPACHSNYSQTSIHASEYPLRRKQLDQFEQVNYPKTMLMDILSYAGYQTAFFSAQNEDWQGMKKFIFAHTKLQHFYDSRNELGDDIGIESKVDDAIVRTRALEYLKTLDLSRPVYMYLNFQASHFPYTIPDNAAHPFGAGDVRGFEYAFFSYDRAHLDTVINRYDNALHYVDTQVGAFIDALKEQGLYENSLIVVASDHGEAFYQHGDPTHGTALFEEQVRTAVLFKLPRGGAHAVRPGGEVIVPKRNNLAPPSRFREDPISLIDINPTILEVLGLKNHPNFQGRPVLRHERGAPVYLVSHSVIKAHGIVDYPWKYIESERDGERLLNLEQDPGESMDFADGQPDILADLKEQLQLYQMRQLYYYTVLPQEDRDRLYPPRYGPE